ncbi:histone-lysine N-methyltransferase PRDM9-like [Belonocnema kinseyi]|uniref:histone-lysine N-methyltransferase PRDM9-like n=1 Tax=Belonocnema kinseyi TaxID=2817044 RepID=UPI00143D51CA|nr:histone-lysine N-methyltransferase PRDM9-like [Belonocnema kinseyi]
MEIKEEFTEIEYIDNDTFKVKEEISEDEETTSQKLNKKYDSNFCTVDIKESDIFSVDNKSPTHKKEKIHISQQDPKKKYKCENCARGYSQKRNLYRHQKLQCNAIRQFRCNFFDKRFKCNKCVRSYTRLDSLYRHIRLNHAEVKRQFICNFCGYKTNVKNNLYIHITSLHMKE